MTTATSQPASDFYRAFTGRVRKTLAAVPEHTAEQPRTWSFIDRESGQHMTVTCMVGCTANHDRDADREIFRADAYCRTWSRGAELPVKPGSADPEPFDLLGLGIGVSPFSNTLAERLPNASLEILDNHYIEDMGPDQLALVIDTLQSRVDALREGHARLVEIRAEYMRRSR